MAKFEPSKLAEYVDEEAKLKAEIQETSVKMHDEKESDEWTDPAKGPIKLINYRKLSIEHEHLESRLLRVSGQREKYENGKPDENSRPKNWSSDAMRRWLMGGSKLLDADEQSKFLSEVNPGMVKEVPLLGIAGGEVFLVDGIGMTAGDPTRSDVDTGDSAAGLAAEEDWMSGLVERLKYFGAVARSCHNFGTDNGNDFHWNQMDSTAQEGAAITDQTQAATGIPAATGVQLPNVTDITFKSYWRHSNFMDARLESFADLQFDIAGRIQREAMRRMGRGWNNWFTTGNGTAKPEGIIASAKVVDGAAGSAYDGSGGIDYANLLDLEYGIDLGYLRGDEGGDGGFRDENGGMIGWMMNRNVEKGLRSAVDLDSRPIWSPSLDRGQATQGVPSMINGFPYEINQHMDDGTAVDSLPLMFGSFGHYGVRNIGGMMFYRFFDSNTVTSMAVRFIAMSRRDGRSLGPIVSAKCDAYTVLQVKA